MFGKNKQPKTVAQITQGLQTMLNDLEVSEAQFEERQRQADAEIARLTAEKADTENELETNKRVRTKFRELLGVTE